jgi:peptidoglycan hydrolase-like protein with peptidoglycan-binding domain
MRTAVLPESGPAGKQRLRQRRIVLVAVVALAVAASVGGLLLATTIKSPAEQAAQTAPPAPTQLTVPVTHQVITSTVLAQGVVNPPAEVAQLSGADSGDGGNNGALPIVTKIFHKVGSIVDPGQEILEVAGRPFFVLQGTVPAYRNLVPGETGTDVAQLQEGLESLGYSIGADTIGTFGAGTAAAVTDFYHALGYTVPTQAGSPTAHGKKPTTEPYVPLSEIMFVPRFPARVVKEAGPVGQEASGSLVTLSMGSPTIAGQLSPNDAALVRPGMSVVISDTATGLSRKGHVTKVGKRTQTTGSISGGLYLPMKIHPSRPLHESLVGHDVSLTITAAHSAGPVLAVPEAAVFARADGRIYVTKLTGRHSSVQVPVRVLVTGNGMVGVAPIDGGTLAAGDQVVIGSNFARGLP